jgi:predicted transcriptional regulator
MGTSFTIGKGGKAVRMTVTVTPELRGKLEELAKARQEDLRPIIVDAIEALYREEFEQEEER